MGNNLADQMHLDRQSKKAEADFYKRSRLAAANEVRFSAAYITHRLHSALANTPKTYFGRSVTDLLQGDARLAEHLATLQSGLGDVAVNATTATQAEATPTSSSGKHQHHQHKK